MTGLNGPTAEALLENSLVVAEVGARSGAALPRGLRARSPPDPVTSVNGRTGDIFIGWTHALR